MGMRTSEIMFSSGSRITGSDGLISSSIIGPIFEIDPDDPTGGSIQVRVPSGSIKNTSSGTRNNDRILLYFSGSGEIGIGTKNPTGSIDIRDTREDTEETKGTSLLSLDKDSGQEFSTPITASSHISSSGNIIGVSGSVQHLKATGVVTASDIVSSGTIKVRDTNVIDSSVARLTFSVSGTQLQITDGTSTWTLTRR